MLARPCATSYTRLCALETSLHRTRHVLVRATKPSTQPDNHKPTQTSHTAVLVPMEGPSAPAPVTQQRFGVITVGMLAAAALVVGCVANRLRKRYDSSLLHKLNALWLLQAGQHGTCHVQPLAFSPRQMHMLSRSEDMGYMYYSPGRNDPFMSGKYMMQLLRVPSGVPQYYSEMPCESIEAGGGRLSV